MIANEETTIIEQVRAMKEANAGKHDFDVARIIASARLRQEESGHRIIRQAEKAASDYSTSHLGSKPEDN